MYAIGKHIKKAMAAFLCACLLLSYNPGLGTVGTAEAVEEVVALQSPAPSQDKIDGWTGAEGSLDYGDDGDESNGVASTTVNVSTYEGGLQTSATPSFSADTTQISANSPRLIVQAFSTHAANKGSYTYAWTLARDGETAPAAIQNVLKNAKYLETNPSDIENSASVINLKSLFVSNNPDGNYFEDGHVYTFTCTTTCVNKDSKEPDTAVNVIELVTVDSKDYDYPPTDPTKPIPPNPFDPTDPEDPTKPINPSDPSLAHRLDATSNNGVAAIIYTPQGGFREGSALQSDVMDPTDQQTYYGKLFDKGALKLPADPKDADYELGPVLVNSITGAKTTDDDATLPAYVGELTMFVPIDNDAYKTTYKEGDPIYVLYQAPGDTTNPAKYVQGKVVKDPDNASGTLKAAFVIDAATGPYMPGYVAVAYAPSKVQTKPNPADPENPTPVKPLKTSFTVTADYADTKSMSYGTIESTADLDEGVWTTGTNASYTFVPRASERSGNGFNTYSLEWVKLGLTTSNPDNSSEMPTIVNGNDETTATVTIDDAPIFYTFKDGVLTLMNCAAKTDYRLIAKFRTDYVADSTIKDPEDPDKLQTYKVFASIEGDGVTTDGKTDIGDCSVAVSYFDADGANAEDVLNGKTPNFTSASALQVDAVTKTTVSFTVTESEVTKGDKAYTYYLKEIKSGSTQISPVATTTTVKNTVNGDPIYRTFVIGKRLSTFDPATKLYANFTTEGPGKIAAGFVSTDVPFQKDEPGATIVFEGDEGYYPEYARVTKTNGELLDPHLSLGNDDCVSRFAWTDYTGFGYDVNITVYFTTIPPIPYYTLILGDAGDNGTIAPSGWNIDPNGYREGTQLKLSVKPDEGYKLDGGTVTVTYAGESGLYEEKVPVAGGFATITMKDDVIDVSGDFVAATLKPGETWISKSFKLGVYVAGADDAALATNMGYALKGGTPTVVGTGEANMSLDGYSTKAGLVNGKRAINTVVTATKADGYPTYSLSMEAATADYEVEKILVVKYDIVGSTKKATSRTLYYNSWYAFDVTDIDNNTDVLVYFKKLEKGDKPAYDPEKIEWRTVTTVYSPAKGVGADTTYPTSGDAVRIVKGQGYMNRIVPGSAYRWKSLEYDGIEVSGIEGSAAAQTVNLTSVLDDTDILARFKDYQSGDDPNNNPGDDTAYYTLSAPNKIAHGFVTAGIGSGSRDLGTWSGVVPGSQAELVFAGDEGYGLSELKFSVDAASGKKMQVNPTTKHLRFVDSSTLASGEWQAFDPNTNYATDSDKTADSVTWTIDNLLGSIYIAPAFALASGGGSGDGDDEGNDDGGILEPDPAKIHVVNAMVGKGRGTIYCRAAKSGFPMRVERTDPPRTITMVFNGDTTEDGVKYEIESVTVTENSDPVSNMIEALATALPFVQSNTQRLGENAAKDGYLTLDVDASYDVVVNFALPKGAAVKDSQVLVNAQSDPYKGTVSPTSATLSKADGTQQFVVSPFKNSGGLYYSVESVDVTYNKAATGSATTENIKAGDKSKDFLTWDTSYANVFTLNVGALKLGDNNINPVTVKVNYSNDPNVAGSFEGGSGQTPALSLMKQMRVLVDGSDGGSVNPEGGPFYILREKNDKTNTWSSQKVSVSANPGYEVKGITVTIEGKERPDLAADYLASVKAEKCFRVSTQDQGDEVITVSFKQLPIGASTFTLHASVSDATKGDVMPGGDNGTVRLMTGSGKTATFTAAPAQPGWAVVKIEDTYVDADGDRQVIPASEDGSATWTRPDGPGNEAYWNPDALKDMHNIFEAGQVNIDNVVIAEREIVVTFGNVYSEYTAKYGKTPAKPAGDEAYDFTGPNGPNDIGKDTSAKQVDLKVKVYGKDGPKLDIDPRMSQEGVYKGSAYEYPYTFSVPEGVDSKNKNLRIYCVEINGKIVHGNKTSLVGAQLLDRYSMIFDEDNMTRKSNVLSVYVSYFSDAQLTTTTPFKVGSGQIDAEGVGGGEAIKADQSGSGVASRSASYAILSDRTVSNGDIEFIENEGDNSGQTPKPSVPGEGDTVTGGNNGNVSFGEPDIDFIAGDEDGTPVDCYFVPLPGYVVGRVALMNCEVVEFAWVTPRDVQDATGVDYSKDPTYKDHPQFAEWLDWPIVLKYSLLRVDPEENAKAIARFKQMPDDEKDTWLSGNAEEIFGEDEILGNTKGDATGDNAGFNAALNKHVQVSVPGDMTGLTTGSILQVTDPDAKVAEWYVKEATDEQNTVRYKTIDPSLFDETTGDFVITVGPLIETDADGNPTVVYTINKEWIAKNSEDSTDPTSLNLTVQDKATYDKEHANEGSRLLMLAEGDEAEGGDGGDGATTDENKEECYNYYVITGNVKNFPDTAKNADPIKIDIPVEARELKDVKLPEFDKQGNEPGNNPDDNNPGNNPDDNNPGNNPGNNPDDNNPGNNPGGDSNQGQNTVQKTVKITANVGDSVHGHLEPATGMTVLSGSNTAAGEWIVRDGAYVRLKVSPDPGYVLTALKRDGNSCFLNGEYSFRSTEVSFIARNDTNLEATYELSTNANTVDVKVEVVGGYGSTIPTSGYTVPVPIGSPMNVTLIPDTGYVPAKARLVIDGKDQTAIDLGSSQEVVTFKELTRVLAGAPEGGYDGVFPELFNESLTIQVSFRAAGSPSGSNPNGIPSNTLVPTGASVADAAGSLLSKTGDNPLLLITLIVVAAGAVAAVVTIRRRKAATEARAQKHSVTRRR